MNSTSESWDEALLNLIHGDVDDALALLAKQDTAARRRALIRAIFAAIEGTLFILRVDVLDLIKRGTYYLSVGDIALLSEEAYSLDTSKLEANTKPKYIPLPLMFKYTIKHWTLASGISYTLDTGNSGWQALRRAIDVRNRITHPKKPEDFSISDSDLSDTKKAYEWFYAVYHAIHQSMIAKHKGEIKISMAETTRLKQQLSKLRKS